MDVEKTGRAIELALREREFSKKKNEEAEAFFTGAHWTDVEPILPGTKVTLPGGMTATAVFPAGTHWTREQVEEIIGRLEFSQPGSIVELPRGMKASDVAAFINLNREVLKSEYNDTDRIDFLKTVCGFPVRQLLDDGLIVSKPHTLQEVQSILTAKQAVAREAIRDCGRKQWDDALYTSLTKDK